MTHNIFSSPVDIFAEALLNPVDEALVPKTIVIGRSDPNPHAIAVGRPSPYGNPYRIGVDGDRDTVIQKYRGFLRASPSLVAAIRKNLAGRLIRCPGCDGDEACHAHVVAAVANGEAP